MEPFLMIKRVGIKCKKDEPVAAIEGSSACKMDEENIWSELLLVECRVEE